MTAELAERIEWLWDENRVEAGPVEEAISLLDRGEARVAEPDGDGAWRVNAWVKQAILLYFRAAQGRADGGRRRFEFHDKIPLKSDLAEARRARRAAGRRALRRVPRAGVIVMPGYVNIGAWVGAGTMVDTWATVGSCAQIGTDVHLSGGVGIGGVLEPPQARPVIVEDGCVRRLARDRRRGRARRRGGGARRRTSCSPRRRRSST